MIGIETTTLQLYRNLIASTDRLALMSLLESQLNDPGIFTTLPIQSLDLRRSDGIVRRADWRPTRIHLQFLDMLRAHARQVSSGVPELFGAETLPEETLRLNWRIIKECATLHRLRNAMRVAAFVNRKLHGSRPVRSGFDEGFEERKRR